MIKHNFLSTEEKQAIHEASCRVLAEVGVQNDNPRAGGLFEGAGAVSKDGRIFIPPELVDKAIRQTAHTLTFGARDPGHNMRIGAETPALYFGTGGQAVYVLEHTGEEFVRKSADGDDLIRILRICEQLPNVDFITRPVEPDVPTEQIDIEKTRIFLANTTKHMNLANLVNVDNLPKVLEMVGDKSLLSFVACVPVSPLRIARDTADKLIAFVEADIPVAISSCPQGGTTAPLSEVGELIQVNAEILSCVVLANIVRSRAKVMYRGIPITSNLYTDCSPRWCQPDAIRRTAIAAELSAYYDIPCCGTAGVSDERTPNVEALVQKTLSWFFESIAGAQFINSAVGMLEQVMTVCLEQYIIDDKALTFVKKVLTDSVSEDINRTALGTVRLVLEAFGLEHAEVLEEAGNRIRFILSAREEYSQRTLDARVELIRTAVLSDNSSAEFIIDANTGLQEGWLYRGKQIEKELELTDIVERKACLLGS